MQEAIAKADTLLEALGWIREFRDKTTVIKLGGSVMEHPDALRHVLLDIVFMATVGMRPVIVHGGGAAISRAMEEAGVEPRFVQGRRVTDETAMEIVRRVLVDEINPSLAETFEQLGGRAMTLSVGGDNVLLGRRLKLKDEAGQEVDLGAVGEVTQVDSRVIENLCYAGQAPFIPSICEDENGDLLNVNADSAATAVAQAMRAEKLVFLSDVNGVRRDKDVPDSLIHSLTASEAEAMIRSGAIDAGMIPKVEACVQTLKHGVSKVHIVDGRLRHSLMLEIYTTSGVGTQIVRDRDSAGDQRA